MDNPDNNLKVVSINEKQIDQMKTEAQILVFSFKFNEPPAEKEISEKFVVLAHSASEAWKELANNLSCGVDTLMGLKPKVEILSITGEEIIISNSNYKKYMDPWADTLKQGIRDITGSVTDMIKSTRGERINKEKEEVKTDRLVLIIFGVGFLAALLFSFFLIYWDKTQPVYNFLFPIITGIVGLIGGHMWGRGRSQSTR